MSEHLEIEFKTLVSPQDFKRLIAILLFKKRTFLRKQIIILIRTIFN